jgi:hypothetical protein
MKWLETLKKLAGSRAERLSPTWLAVQPEVDGNRVRARVKDISPTGVYLQTNQRWAVGQVFFLEVLGEGLGKEVDPELYLTVEARVARHGKDGVGFSFVLPEGLDPKLWETLIYSAFLLSSHKHIVLSFRLIRAVLFLCGLCPSSVQEVFAGLGGGLHGPRAEVSIAIANKAEKLLKLKANWQKLRAHPGLVVRILREGSWALDVVTQDLWAGLLAGSCDAEGTDDSNQEYVELLTHLTPSQARIFVAGCSQARQRLGEDSGTQLPVVLATRDEMTKIIGQNDLSRIGTEMAYLFHNGFLEELSDFSSYKPVDKFRITPSTLGMKLFLACSPQAVPR